jgi:hypothetical protein
MQLSYSGNDVSDPQEHPVGSKKHHAFGTNILLKTTAVSTTPS